MAYIDHDPNDVTRYSNVGIALAYFAVGFVMSFVSTPMNVYMVNVLNAEPAMQTTIGILQTLPWSLKLVFGFLSDAVPIFGLHRKPYLTLGAVLYSFAFILYAAAGRDSILLLAACLFVGTIGLITMDVMCDTMCVERSRFESNENKGQMQATYYSVRFAGGILGSFGGALVYNKANWGWGLTFHQIAMLNGVIPFFLVTPWLYCLVEKYRKHRFSDGSVLVVPKDVEVNESMRHLAAAVTAASEDTPLLMHKSSSRGHGLAIPHPTEHVTVTHHHDHHHGTSAADGGDDEEEEEELEVGLQMQSMMRPTVAGAGQMRGGTGVLLESHTSSHHSSGHLHQDGEAAKAKAAADVESNKKNGTAAAAAAATGEEEEEETDEALLNNVRKQLNDIWDTVQLKSVWRPMAFVYVFNVLQTPNVAWQSFLQLSLHFEPYILGLMVSVGSFMTFAGVLAYKYFFFKTSWRKIYIWSVVLITFFSLLQLVLVAQWNVKYLHINNYLFSLGDDIISAYISGIQFLPLCIMYMKLCPEGSEGASYSMLTTFSNIAVVCSYNLGTSLSKIWDVSNSAMKEGRLGGLWNLTILTSCITITPLCLLHLLPNSAEEQEELSKCKDKSRTGGVIFLSVLFGSIFWSMGSALYHLYEAWAEMQAGGMAGDDGL